MYTQHQHLALILLKEMMRMDYRSIIDLVDIMTGIRDLLELGQIPHFTTLHKFLQRIRAFHPDILLKRVMHLCYERGEEILVVTIDSSGITGSCASSHYTWRTGAIRGSYLKTSIAMDTGKQVITGSGGQ